MLNIFRRCTNLNSVSLPSSLQFLDSDAFSSSPNLSVVKSLASNPPVSNFAFLIREYLSNDEYINICTNLWNGEDPEKYRGSNFMKVYDNATLYVPKQSLSAYKEEIAWRLFRNILPLDGDQETFSLQVIDENETDITNEVNIIWHDINGKQIGTGQSIKANDSIVYYSVVLNEVLGRKYHEVNSCEAYSGDEPNICRLERIKKVNLKGRVSALNIDLKPAEVHIRQMLNGKYEELFNTTTNEQGDFEIEVFDDITDIIITHEEVGDATFQLHRDGLGGDANIGTIILNPLSRKTVNLEINYIPITSANESPQVIPWIDEIGNLEFSLTNQTSGNPIAFSIQNNSIVLLSGFSVGESIQIYVKSKKRQYADNSVSLTLSEENNNAKLTLKELGAMHAVYKKSDNINCVGYLYDKAGILVAKSVYLNNELTMEHLYQGTYTLVSMGCDQQLTPLSLLSQYKEAGLVDGLDFVSTNVEITDAVTSEISFNNIPVLNKTDKDLYISYSYYYSDKASVMVGDYITFSTKIIWNKDISSLNNLNILIDIPEGSELVKGSVMAGNEKVNYQLNDGQLVIPLSQSNYQEKIRFCLIPTENKVYSITIITTFDIGEEVVVPLGTVSFKTNNLVINAPKTTAKKTINIYGYSKAESRIRIYDNGVLIGNTTSKNDGSWLIECELDQPYENSFHNIYAKVNTNDGLELTSPTEQVLYDSNYPVPTELTMLYYNPEYDKDYRIVFNMQNGYTSIDSYNFFPYANWPNWRETMETTSKEFTFLADFAVDDNTIIKNVSFRVLATDGTIRTIPATFDTKQGKWVGTSKYKSEKLPTNVTIDYYLDKVTSPFNSERMEDDNNQFVNILENFVTNIDLSEVKILDADEHMAVCQYQTTSMAKPVFIRVEKLNYEGMISYLDGKEDFMDERGGHHVCFKYSAHDAEYIAWMWTKANASLLQFELSDTNSFEGTDAINKEMKTSTPKRAELSGLQEGARDVGSLIKTSVLNIFCNAGDIINIINEYNAGLSSYSAWETTYANLLKEHDQFKNVVRNRIEAKCPDGTRRLSESNYQTANENLRNYQNETLEMRKDFRKKLDRVRRDLDKRRNFASMLSATACFGGALLGLGGSGGTIIKEIVSNIIEDLALNTISEAYSCLVKNEFYTTDQLNEWYTSECSRINQKYVNLPNKIERAYQTCCKSDNENEQNEEYYDASNPNRPEFPAKSVTPVIDPSGYVYEAVPSNRLSGVTTTIYQKLNDEVVKWNAEDFSQQNPLLTDDTGFYRWDVPMGEWQVKYEKEGYETLYSDWLPVPPPQLDVNIGMKQSTPPTVKLMRGFESGITVEMSKYMIPATMTTDNITITRNGIAEMGSIELINTEDAPLGGETYVSKVKFIPENGFNTTDIVVVTIHKEVESYCGVKMTADHVETVEIESEVKSIVTDSEVTIPYQGQRELRVLVLPKEASANKTLHVNTSSAIIASTNTDNLTIDQNGAATVIIGGELPGGAILNFNVDGTDVTASSKVKVVIGRELVAMPTANIISGETIEKGTQIVLTCDTEGATIYYTLDGSCPCNEATRHKYDGPISIVSDVIVKAIAVKEGMDDSDIATFIYMVKMTDGINGKNNSHNFKVTYAGGKLMIIGAEGGSCHIYDYQGRELAECKRLQKNQAVSVPKTEVYILCVTFADRKMEVRKVTSKP